MTDPVIERHRDEIDAAQAANIWVDRLIQELPPSPHFEVVRYNFARPGGGIFSGGLRVYWHNRRVVAQITFLRDDANFTIVTMVDLRDQATAERPLMRWDYTKRRLTLCQTNLDGVCTWFDCPQRRDGEPAKSGRTCPWDEESALYGE